MKQTKKVKKIKEKAWGVIDNHYDYFVADGSGHLAIYFDKKGAARWKKEMLGKDGRVVSAILTFTSPKKSK